MSLDPVERPRLSSLHREVERSGSSPFRSRFVAEQEAYGESVHTPVEIWIATGATFLIKFLIALTFLVPVLVCELPIAIVLDVAWGLGVLTVLSYQLAQAQGVPAWKVISEHLVIAGAVLTTTHVVGDWVKERADFPEKEKLGFEQSDGSQRNMPDRGRLP